jgi:hypothetical protein
MGNEMTTKKYFPQRRLSRAFGTDHFLSMRIYLTEIQVEETRSISPCPMYGICHILLKN